MRGEHEVEAAITTYDPGSSPHARGAPVGVLDADAPAGIIPACAGSTTSTAAQTGGSRDHPRMRGEHWVAQLTRLWSGGSSPHARGALRVRRLRHRAPGIIPACAGSTRSTASTGGGGAGIIPACAGSTTARIGSRCAGWDHPRMRGEHFDQIDSQSERGGSSPHARGARAKLIRVLVGRRIIPACAGSTPTTPGTACPTGDHPRMRGEHCFAC